MIKIFLNILGFFLILLIVPSVLAHQQTTIIFKDQQFTPAEVNLDQGQEVIFQNDSSEDVWPASDLHPTHTIYPQFDSKEPIKPGKSWTFKFERSGKFKFHDHLAPHIGGIITAKDSATTVATSSVSPKKFSLSFPSLSFNWEESYIQPFFLRIYYFFFPKQLTAQLQKLDAYQISQDEKKLRYWINIIGGDQFMDKLVADTDGGSKMDCHQEAHLVGRAAYELFGNSAFRNINYNCHSGYIHGAMEAFIKQNEAKPLSSRNGTKNLMRRVENLCNRYKTDFTKFECLHGIGHGLTAYDNYDIPKALNSCHELSSDYSRRSCFGGVFMENIMVAEGKGAIKGHKTDWVSSDPHFPCDSVDQSELVQYECYQMQTSRMLELFDYNFPRISYECQRAPANMVGVCFRSMGRDIAGQTLRDPDKMINLCQLSPPNFYQECLTGGLNVIVDFWGETITDQPQQFCNKLANPRDKSYCFQTLGQRLKNIFGNNKSKIEDACKLADTVYYQTCLSSSHQT